MSSNKECLASKLLETRAIISLAAREMRELLEYAEGYMPELTEDVVALQEVTLENMSGAINQLIYSLRAPKRKTRARKKA